MVHDASRSRYEQVAEQLRSGSFDLFTCDVFDTLVWRPVASPTDLFVQLGERLASQGLLAEGFDPVEFSGTRQWAEGDARRQLWRESRSRECNLEEIWRAMPSTITDAGPIEAFIDAELDCEASHISVHAETANLLSLARSLGVRTALVSDTYLSADQLASTIRSAGVDPVSIDRIVTSSDARVG